MIESRYGWCPACRTDELKLVEHHCHLWKAVLDYARLVVEPVVGVKRAETLPSAMHWSQDPRFRPVWRFPKTRICVDCNNIDSCWPAMSPGKYFSLSPDEMLLIRQRVGTRENRGELFKAALAEVRIRARPDYVSKLQRAEDLGADMALAWISRLEHSASIT